MSFADLKSKRQSESSKSYVSALNDPIAVASASASQASVSTVRNDVVTDTDGLYSQLPSSLEIRKTDRCGRGLWTRQPFEPGSILLSVEPHVFVLSNQYLGSHCSSCTNATLTSPLMRCSGCGVLRYCNSFCQKADWTLHKRECVALQRWARTAPSAVLSVPNDAVRCLGRILWRMKAKGLSSGWSKAIQAMQSNKLSPQQSVSVEAHVHLAQSVVRYLGMGGPSDLEEYGITSPSDLANTISRFITNTFALTSPSLTPIGASVSPLAAFTNHSCLPNVAIVFPRTGKTRGQEPIMNVIALRDIAAGEEVLMTYTDTTLPKIQRQKALADTYDFICQCPLCKPAVTAVDPREALLCPKSCGGTCPIPNEDDLISRCCNCKAAITDPNAVMDAVRIGQEALDKATGLQLSDHAKAAQLTTNMIPILVSAGLASSCHPLLALLKLHQSLLLASFSEKITQQRLDESIRTAVKHVAGLSAVLSEGHPVRGIALAELGKLLAVDEPSPSSPPQTTTFPPSGPARLNMAYETLLKARNELLVGFGRENEGGEVGREVREAIVALEKELGVWSSGIRNVLGDMPTKRSGKA